MTGVQTCALPIYLRAGRLVRPFPLSLKAPFGYYVVSPRQAAFRPKVVAFREWLLAEAEQDVRDISSDP